MSILPVLAWIGVISLLSVGVWASYWAPLRDDHYQLIYLGQTILDGGRMYIDCWENKPPGIAWINALGMFVARGSRIGAWVLPGLAAVGGLAVFFVAANRLVGRTASTLTILVGATLMSLRFYDTPSVNPDIYCSQFALAGISLFLWAISTPAGRSRAAIALLAGMAWAAALCFKQTGPIGLVVMTCVAVPVWWHDRSARTRWVSAVVFSLLGFVALSAAWILTLVRLDTLNEAFHAVVTFNTRYAQTGDWIAALRDWGRLHQVLEPMRFALWLGALGFLSVMFAGRVGRITRAAALAIFLWWGTEAIFALLGPSRSVRYWQALWPPTLWLTACGFRYLQMTLRQLPPRQRAGVVFVAATAFFLLIRPTWVQHKTGLAVSYLEYSAESRERDLLANMGRQLSEIVPAHEPISVLSYNAGLYLYAQRRCAARFVYPRSHQQVDELLASLDRKAPYAILVPERPDELFAIHMGPPEQKRIEAALTGYQCHSSLRGYGDYSVYLRTGPPLPAR